jgi:hypothetical protein
MNNITAIRIIIAALALSMLLAAGTSLTSQQQPVYAASQSWFAVQSNNIQSRLAGNLTPLLMPVGQSTTVCPAGTAFGVTNQAALPPGYNTVPVGSMLCMQKLGHQTIPAILPTGTTLILQVIASQPNQATCSAPSAFTLISFGIPPTPATKSLCVELV